MARLNNKTLLGVFVSFLIVLALIAVVRAVFPAALYDGFTNMSCYGVKCNEGEFCQEGVCRPINPGYTNNYYNKGIESFVSNTAAAGSAFSPRQIMIFLGVCAAILAIWGVLALGGQLVTRVYQSAPPVRVNGNIRV